MHVYICGVAKDSYACVCVRERERNSHWEDFKKASFEKCLNNGKIRKIFKENMCEFWKSAYI